MSSKKQPKNPKQAVRSFAADLLGWYRRTARDLPWRRTKDPYQIWVSEVMLQQTRVSTVIPYFNRFIARYPTIRHLAQADTQELMKHWEGLGYYRRVSHMRETAAFLTEHHGATLPNDKAGLMQQKGIGEYIAGAVASIAFNEDCAAVDGNVLRVMSRIGRIEDDISQTATKQKIEENCMARLPRGEAGDFNQALMELGSEICVKVSPLCAACPVSAHCLAYRHKCVDRLPVKAKKKPVPHYIIAAGAVINNGRVLIGLRKPNALLGNLWEFPGGKCLPQETPEAACIREIKEETGLDVAIIGKLCVVKHAYSHFRITLHAFLCRRLKGRLTAKSAVELRYIPPDQMDAYAFPKANHEIIHTLKATLSETDRSVECPAQESAG